MKTSRFVKGIPMFSRACTLVGALFAVVSLAGAGCIGGWTDTGVSEGHRCNPLDSHNECSSGLVCTGQQQSPAIPFCPENYCCSVDSSGNINSSNVWCQPGCNGGAASICAANKDPGACALAGGASLAAAMALDEDGGAAPPATTDDAGTDGGSQEDATAAPPAEAGTDAGAAPPDAGTDAGAAPPPAEAGADAGGD
jgi:hypothetical protein